MMRQMNMQLDQFTDQVLIALDQLISIVLSPFVWFFQHPLADFYKWLLFLSLWEHMQSFLYFTHQHW
ncbi:hypothetical protein [Lacticaseibacillus paracasei]|uniref:hypothetical protein n=1 Tax=Lacticaseibacillus paracasei TaxID=1597 RepID=UPI0021A83403|nr:hypothetical protein [Lacticaseibacillus paracasei]